MKGWIGKALLLVATFASGGLAGAIYTHYVSRPEPASVSASVSTITIANPQSASSLIPDLKVQVGNEVIGSLYAQIVTFDVISGPYVEAADVAISFTNFGPYHLARLRALAAGLARSGCKLVAYETELLDRNKAARREREANTETLHST